MIEAEEISRSTVENSDLLVKEIEEETSQNLSLEEPIVAKTQEIFEEVDQEILASRDFDQSPIQQNDDMIPNSNLEEAVETQSHLSPGIPSPETLARLKAAVTKDLEEKNSLPASEKISATERSKFGISSLIGRMSRSENVNSGTGLSRKEPNFNSDVTDESEIDDLEQEKIEVPAFLRRQAN